MADICKELRKQLHELDVLRESCVSVLVREGIESDTAKETIKKFDALAEELRDNAVFYKQPFSTHLDRIEWKINNDENLTKWEYWVLYGIDQHLKANNYKEKRRRRDMVTKWRSDEEKKRDLAFLFDTTPDRISLTAKEACSGTIRYHYDDLNLGIVTAIYYESTMPEEVGGDLYFGNLRLIRYKTTMPKKIGGELDLCGLTSINNELTMPEEVGGGLWLNGLTSIKTDLTMPKEVGGDLHLNNLTSTQGITNWPVKIIGTVKINTALPKNEKVEMEKRYPGKVEYR